MDLQYVLQILSISQIQECGGVEVSPLEATLHLGLDAVAFLVLPPEEEAQDNDDDDLDQVRHDHGPDTEGVGWAGWMLVRDACYFFCILGEKLTIDQTCRRTGPQYSRYSSRGRGQRW